MTTIVGLLVMIIIVVDEKVEAETEDSVDNVGDIS